MAHKNTIDLIDNCIPVWFAWLCDAAHKNADIFYNAENDEFQKDERSLDFIQSVLLT